MFLNPLLPFALLLGAALFLGGCFGMRRAGRGMRGLLWGAAGVLCLPGLSFVLYYAHLFGEPLWYIAYRTLPGIELLSAGWGLPFGCLLGELQRCGRRYRLFSPVRLGLLALLFVAVPFLKPMILPAALVGMPGDQWQQGVCLQSSASTCGPASLATVFSELGMRHTEAEIARRTYSSASGTELWYLLRDARRHGLQAQCTHQPRLDQVPAPAILGTVVKQYGHFVVYLGTEHGAYIIGDPMYGRLTLSPTAFAQSYRYTGCAMTFRRR